MKLPCKNCLKLPICRYKNYTKLVTDCMDVWMYINPSDKQSNKVTSPWTLRVNEIHDEIRPKYWQLIETQRRRP